MKKKINKFLIFIVIPFVLLLFWLISSIVFNKQISFSVITSLHSKNDIKHSPQGKLLKGESIEGEFRAKENHLGIIILEFKDFTKHDFASEDILNFKLKEKGSKEWGFIGTYRSGLLEHTLYFPFGFPIIDNSKDKIYDFKLTSLYGTEKNAVEFDKSIFSLTTGYQFPKSEITASKSRFLIFLFKKTISSLTNVHFLLSSVLYMVPLIIYLFIFLLSKKFKSNNMLFPLSVLIFILIDIIFLKEIYLGIFLSLLVGWIFIVRRYRLESSVSFFIAIVLIIIWTFMAFLKINNLETKLNIWVYTFFVVGLIQALIEEKNSDNKLIGYRNFFRKIYKLHEKF